MRSSVSKSETTQGLLFPCAYNTFQTEGIKYAGSKKKLIGEIIDVVSPLRVKRVWDAFSGTTRVSQAFAQNGYDVISSDISIWSQCFASCYLLSKRDREYYVPLFDHLNNLQPIDGWYSENYGSILSESEGGIKRPWQLKNTRKLDAIREELDKLDLSPIDKNVALTGLILALDKVDSTLGHYVSYLKEWADRSYNDLFLDVPRILRTRGDHQVLIGDVFDLLPHVQTDLAYLDPPYGSNNEKMPPSRIRYSSYYHIWTTIILNDKPKLFGKANRRLDSSDTLSSSVFEEFRKNEKTTRYIALEAIEKLIRNINAEYVLLSYSTTGRATFEQLMDILSESGKLIGIKSIDYRRHIMSEMKWTNKWVSDCPTENKELLFLLKK